jgi:hypothetical protein
MVSLFDREAHAGNLLPVNGFGDRQVHVGELARLQRFEHLLIEGCDRCGVALRAHVVDEAEVRTVAARFIGLKERRGERW